MEKWDIREEGIRYEMVTWECGKVSGKGCVVRSAGSTEGPADVGDHELEGTPARGSCMFIQPWSIVWVHCRAEQERGKNLKDVWCRKNITLLFSFMTNFISGFTPSLQSSDLCRVACVWVEMPSSSEKESVLSESLFSEIFIFLLVFPFWENCFFSFSSALLKEGTVSVTKLGGIIRMT